MKILDQNKEFTFDDVLLLPNYSSFRINDDVKVVKIKSKVSRNIWLDIPIISSPMPGVTEVDMATTLGSVGGLGIIHHFHSFSRQLELVEQVKAKKLKVGASLADFSEKGLEHCENLLKVGIDLISLESAHANNNEILEFIKRAKKKFKRIELSVAHIVDSLAVEALVKAGADSIRVGIGGGSHCTTRLVTGVGRPQLSSVYECAKAAQKHGVPIISDTGVKYAGDIAKALVFGADAVMIGGLLAGSSDSPGPVIKKDNKSFKMTWGNCSSKAILHQHLNLSDLKEFNPRMLLGEIKRFILQQESEAEDPYVLEEGVDSLIAYKGSTSKILSDLINGLKRSMWYQGAKDIEDLRKKARVIFVTSSTHLENLPRI